MSSSFTSQDLLNTLLKRRLSNDDDDEDGTWEDISSGEKFGIVFITIISSILCLYFCYYIKFRKELPSDRIPLTSGNNKGGMA
mmetsp:Transcript_11636/g.12013  ORF Transcript_11636/g.12013 Transcript_11636/m.12013 type:complete len:83 (+) Transcript_11636:36-284(+)